MTDNKSLLKPIKKFACWASRLGEEGVIFFLQSMVILGGYCWRVGMILGRIV